jgi:hypothetical protein
MALGDVIKTASASAGSSPVDAAFTGSLTVGNMVVVAIFTTNNETDTVTSVTGLTTGKTYVRAGSVSPSQSLTERCHIYYAYDVPATGETVRVALSANGAIVRCLEVESDMTTDPLDKANTGSANGANPSITLTSVLANCFVAGAFAGVNSVTAGTGYTSDFAGNSWNFELTEHDSDSGTAGNVAVTAVMSSGNWTGAAASFRLTPPAGGGPRVVRLIGGSVYTHGLTA